MDIRTGNERNIASFHFVLGKISGELY